MRFFKKTRINNDSAPLLNTRNTNYHTQALSEANSSIVIDIPAKSNILELPNEILTLIVTFVLGDIKMLHKESWLLADKFTIEKISGVWELPHYLPINSEYPYSREGFYANLASLRMTNKNFNKITANYMTALMPQIYIAHVGPNNNIYSKSYQRCDFKTARTLKLLSSLQKYEQINRGLLKKIHISKRAKTYAAKEIALLAFKYSILATCLAASYAIGIIIIIALKLGANTAKNLALCLFTAITPFIILHCTYLYIRNDATIDNALRIDLKEAMAKLSEPRVIFTSYPKDDNKIKRLNTLYLYLKNDKLYYKIKKITTGEIVTKVIELDNDLPKNTLLFRTIYYHSWLKKVLTSWEYRQYWQIDSRAIDALFKSAAAKEDITWQHEHSIDVNFKIATQQPDESPMPRL